MKHPCVTASWHKRCRIHSGTCSTLHIYITISVLNTCVYNLTNAHMVAAFLVARDHWGMAPINIQDLVIHYCMVLLMRHYNQRSFDETVCDAIITNGDVKKHQKGAKRLR